MDSQTYRIDRFVVPGQARDEFLSRVEATHALLRTQAGFLGDAILERASGPGEFNFVTIVRWENAEAMEPARQAVAALEEKMNFNPREMMAKLGIRADIANYKDVGLRQPQGQLEKEGLGSF
jgi:heme-degrading monooxygenase HmoA